MMTSSPGPPTRYDVAAVLLTSMESLPVSPLIVTLWTSSALRSSSPASPRTTEFPPGPTEMLSLPAPPQTVSFPPRPSIVSSPSLPTMTSLPFVPSMRAGPGWPEASSQVRLAGRPLHRPPIARAPPADSAAAPTRRAEVAPTADHHLSFVREICILLAPPRRFGRQHRADLLVGNCVDRLQRGAPTKSAQSPSSPSPPSEAVSPHLSPKPAAGCGETPRRPMGPGGRWGSGTNHGRHTDPWLEPQRQPDPYAPGAAGAQAEDHMNLSKFLPKTLETSETVSLPSEPPEFPPADRRNSAVRVEYRQVHG